MTEHEQFIILPAEYLGDASAPNKMLDIGGVQVPVWSKSISVYVRRINNDLSVIEVAMARHDGLAQEELDERNAEADRYPLGPKEYWRTESVGKCTYGADGHLMTDEEFEADWAEAEDYE